MTDLELKLKLAKEMPELIYISDESEYGTANTHIGFRWLDTNNSAAWEDWFEITDREWDWVVREVIKENCHPSSIRRIYADLPINNATWQQRAEAYFAVKANT